MKREITVDVKVKMHVDEDTAQNALNIIEIWLEENADRRIEAEQLTDGSWIMNLIPEERQGEKE